MTLSLPPVQPPTRPPIRPSRLTRLANRLGVRSRDLLIAVIATIVGAPVVGTAVLLATVPVPQASAVPFDPAPATIAPVPPVAQTPSPAPEAALTAPRAAPRVHVAPEPVRPSRTRSGPPTTSPAATSEPAAEPTPSPPTSSAPETSDTGAPPTPTGGADVP